MSSDRVTIKDLARKLNVAPSTVSRALQDHPEIGKDTIEAVKKLAKELNYRPNSVALSLRQKKTFTIGVVVPEIVHYFFSSVISGIEDAAYESNYQVILCQSNEKYDHELMNIQTLANSQVDGVLISYSKETKDFQHIESLVEQGIPVVFYDRSKHDVEVDSVIVDDFGGAYEAVDHLIKVGCEKIVHLKGPEHVEIHNERINGYLQALKDHQIPIDPSLIVKADNFNAGYQAVMDLLDSKTEFDGLFAVNDLTAVGAMKALKSIGRTIPEDVAVVGFGDDSNLSEMVEPALSSVFQPGFEEGKRATELLLKKINDDKSNPQLIKLDTKLQIRKSSSR